MLVDLVVVGGGGTTEHGGELPKHQIRVESDVRDALDGVAFDHAVADVKKQSYHHTHTERQTHKHRKNTALRPDHISNVR